VNAVNAAAEVGEEEGGIVGEEDVEMIGENLVVGAERDLNGEDRVIQGHHLVVAIQGKELHSDQENQIHMFLVGGVNGDEMVGEDLLPQNLHHLSPHGRSRIHALLRPADEIDRPPGLVPHYLEDGDLDRQTDVKLTGAEVVEEEAEVRIVELEDGHPHQTLLCLALQGQRGEEDLPLSPSVLPRLPKFVDLTDEVLLRDLDPDLFQHQDR
jgi:hypothetical protein